MSPPFEKKYTWIDRDSTGRLCLFRKVRKSYKYEKKVIEIHEKDEYEYGCGCGCIDTYDLPTRHTRKDKHKREDDQVYEHKHHHYYFHDPPSPRASPSPEPVHQKGARCPETVPIVELPPKVEVRRPRNRSPSPPPCSHPFKLREFLFCCSPPSAALAPIPRSPRPAKVYHVVDPHIKLEKVPVHKLCKATPCHPAARLEKVKVERLRPEHLDDFELQAPAPRHHERGRGRARHRDCEHDEDDDNSHVEAPRVRVPRRLSYSRTRVMGEREEERARWDEELEAFVVKRAPVVRFE